MQPVLLTVNGTGTSAPVTMDYMQNPFQVGIGVVATGGAVKPRLDRPGRKTGGRVGADRAPLSSAHGVSSPAKESAGGKPD